MTPTVDTQEPVDRALAGIFRLLVRARIIGSLVPATLSVLFIVNGEPLWKAVLSALASVSLFSLSAWTLRRPLGRVSPADLLRLLISIIGAQLTLITLTGGLRSPFLALTPPIVLGLALGTGQLRWTRPAVVIVLAAITVLGVGDLAGAWRASDLVPTVLHRDDGATAPGYVVAVMIALTLVTIATVVIGLGIRGAFQRALGEAVSARAELLEATRGKHRELEALSGALAHELKNPLASIRGLASLLARKLPEGSKEAERMDVLLGEVSRMGQILDEFLNFSRPAEGLATSDVAAARLVDEVLALHEGEALQKGVALARDVRASVDLHVDPRKLKQVLVNLVQNALEASPPGGVVTLRAAELAEAPLPLVFEVEDDGPGLDPAIAGRLFSAGATTKPAGTGLGLVIARGIAEQHDGRLTLEPRAGGRGSIARLALPAAARAGGRT